MYTSNVGDNHVYFYVYYIFNQSYGGDGDDDGDGDGTCLEETRKSLTLDKRSHDFLAPIVY